jgi:UDP-glucuronate 4-epimerase
MAPELDPYEIFNIGNHRAEPLGKVIALLEQELGVKAKQELLPMQPGDVPATFADVARARAKLGFNPATPIESGIPRFISWFKQYHNPGKPD